MNKAPETMQRKQREINLWNTPAYFWSMNVSLQDPSGLSAFLNIPITLS